MKQRKYYIIDDISGRLVCKLSTGGLHLSQHSLRSIKRNRWLETNYEFSLEKARKIVENYKELNWPSWQNVNGNRPKMALRMMRKRGKE